MNLSRRSSTHHKPVIQKEKRNRKGDLIVSRETFGERAGGSDMRRRHFIEDQAGDSMTIICKWGGCERIAEGLAGEF